MAIFGQKPITKVGNNKLKPIVSSLPFISLTVARAGILGPKNTLLHIERRYIGVRTRPIAAIRIVNNFTLSKFITQANNLGKKF